MSNVESSICVVTQRASSTDSRDLSISLSVPHELRDRFEFVQPKGTIYSGFTLYDCAQTTPGARKIVRRDFAQSDEIGFTIAVAGVPLSGTTQRAAVPCELVELDGIRALQFAPFDMRNLPARAPKVFKTRRRDPAPFNAPTIVRSQATALCEAFDERGQLRRSVAYLRGPIELKNGCVDLQRLWAAVISIYKLGPKNHIQLAVKDGQLEASEVVKRDLFEDAP